MINKKYVFLFLVVVLLSSACSKNRNTWFNRKYQNTVSRFNYYYNGNEKLKEMKASLELNNKDDYTKILKVFPYGGDEAAKQQGPLADEIIKKTSKIILDRPISKWVDDSYLLLGKAYLFKGDYYSAMDAFSYVMSRYANTPIAKEAEIWNLYAIVRNNKFDDAEATLLTMKNEEKKQVLSKEIKPFYNSVAAQIMIEQKKHFQATEFLKNAILFTKKKKDKARLYFVMAQVQNELKETDSVKFYLRKVLKSNPNFDMAFEAKLSIAKSYDAENPASIREARKYLYSMLKEEKNLSYYDQIYYQLALIDQQENNTADAVENFKKSAAASVENKNQKGLTFLALAELFYDIPDYPNAQAYFDSTIQFLQKDYPNYNAIYKKQSILSELIKYKVQIQQQDSLLLLSKLSPEQLDKLIDKWIKDDEEKKQKDLEDHTDQMNTNFQNQNLNDNNASSDGGSGASWYFYNKVNMSKGKSDFDRKWGNRKLEDNWRVSAIMKNQFTNTNTQNATDIDGGEIKEKKNDIRSAYKENIPDTEIEKREANDKVMKALLKVGNIYFEQLKDMQEAIKNYEELLKRYPDSEYEPEVLYKLFRANENHGVSLVSNTFKQRLISKYPNSDFAYVAQNKVLDEVDENVSMDKNSFYESIYNLYLNKKYKEVIKLKDTAIVAFNATNLSPKYALLYAFSVAKTQGKDAYLIELEKIILQFLGTPEEEVATRELDNLKQGFSEINDNPNAKEKAFVYKASLPHWALIVVPNGRVDMNKIKLKLSDFNDVNFKLISLSVTSQYIDKSYQLLIVKSFDKKNDANEYIEGLKKTQNLFSDFPEREFKYWIITEENYLQILKQKQIEPYEIFYNKYYK